MISLFDKNMSAEKQFEILKPDEIAKNLFLE